MLDIKIRKFIIYCCLIFLCLTKPVIAQNVTNENHQDNFAISSESLGTEAITSIMDRGILRVGMPENDDFPFYQFKTAKSKEIEGIDADFANGLAQELGVKLEFIRHFKTHDEIIAAVARGEVDCGIAKFSRTPQRGTKVLFTQPYLVFHPALLVNRNLILSYQSQGLSIEEIFTSNFEDSLAVLKGTSYVTFARKMFPRAITKEYQQWDDAVQAVVERKAFAAFRDEVEVRSIILNNPALAFQLKSVIIADFNDGKGVAVNPNNLLLKETANLYIDNYYQPIKAEEVLERIKQFHETKSSKK